jgi:hypothetical protein
LDRAFISPPPRQVTTEHVLLGLVSEDAASSKHGYLGCGLTPEAAYAAVETLSGRRHPVGGEGHIPFAREVRKVFEAATSVSDFWQGARGLRHGCMGGGRHAE